MTERTRDRRRAPRTRVRFSIEVTDPTGTHRAEVRDLSSSGMMAIFPDEIPEMTAVQLGFQLPGEKGTLHAEGVVVRCEPAGEGGHEIAFYFTDMTWRSRSALVEWVQSRLHDGQEV